MSTKTVMLAEDEALVALDLACTLEDAGLDVVGPCMSVEDILDYIDRGQPVDVALLDVDLAGTDVFPAARELERRGVPILFHTAHGDRAELESGFARARLLRKPCDPDVLVHEIEQLAA